MRCPSCGHDNIPGVDLCESCGMDLAGLDVHGSSFDPADPLLSQPISGVPLAEPLTRPLDATVSDAIGLMQERGEGCVFVMDGARLAGVLTERDVTRVISRGLDPTRTRLDRAMTPEPMRLREEDPLAWALHRMGVDGYRHIPVTRDGSLRGFLSARSVLRRLLD